LERVEDRKKNINEIKRMKKQKKQALGLAVDEQGDCRPQEERRTGETAE